MGYPTEFQKGGIDIPPGVKMLGCGQPLVIGLLVVPAAIMGGKDRPATASGSTCALALVQLALSSAAPAPLTAPGATEAEIVAWVQTEFQRRMGPRARLPALSDVVVR